MAATQFTAHEVTDRGVVFLGRQHIISVPSMTGAKQLAKFLNEVEGVACPPRQIVRAVAKALNLSIDILEAN